MRQMDNTERLAHSSHSSPHLRTAAAGHQTVHHAAHHGAHHVVLGSRLQDVQTALLRPMTESLSFPFELLLISTVLQSMADWSVYESAAFDWNIDLEEWLHKAMVLQFDFHVVWRALDFRVECIFSAMEHFWFRYGITLLTPLLCAFLFVLNFIVGRLVLLLLVHRGILNRLHCSVRLLHDLSDLDWLLNTIGTLMVTFSVTLTAIALSIFQCDDNPYPNATQTLRKYPEVICESEEWERALPLAVIGTCLYASGAVVFIAYICWVAPRRCHAPQFRARYLIVFYKLRPEVYWWRLVILLKGLILNLLMTFLATSPRVLAVSVMTLYMGSISMLYLHLPWVEPIHNAIDAACHVGGAMFLVCLTGHLKGEEMAVKGSRDNLALLYYMEVVALMAPMAFTMLCVVEPLYRYNFRTRLRVRAMYEGQRFRDVVLLLARQTNVELNHFWARLDESSRRLMVDALNVVYARMYQCQPVEPWRQRLIPEADCFEIATDEKILDLLVDSMRAGRHDVYQSLKERALVQWFVDVLSDTSMLLPGRGCLERRPGISDLYEMLDPDASGTITKREFMKGTQILAPLVRKHEAAQIFDIVDTDSSGELSREEFEVIFSGMTWGASRHPAARHSASYATPSRGASGAENRARRLLRLAAMLVEDPEGSNARSHDRQPSGETDRRARMYANRRLRKVLAKSVWGRRLSSRSHQQGQAASQKVQKPSTVVTPIRASKQQLPAGSAMEPGAREKKPTSPRLASPAHIAGPTVIDPAVAGPGVADTATGCVRACTRDPLVNRPNPAPPPPKSLPPGSRLSALSSWRAKVRALQSLRSNQRDHIESDDSDSASSDSSA